LRVLEESTRQYRRLGGAENKEAKCKFIIADTVSPKAALGAGVHDEKRLIQEVYSRVAYGGVVVLPLRDRRDDIPLLTKLFLDKFNPSHNKVTLEDEVLDRFYKGHWGGNVRALHDIVRRVVHASTGCVGWPQVVSCFDPDVLSPEVGEEQLVHKRVGRADRGILQEKIRASLSQGGRALFEALEQKLQNPPTKLDLDPYNVYSLLHYLSADRSRRIRANESLTVLGIAEVQFAKVVSVLYESSTDNYKKYHLITMLKEERDGRARTYRLMSNLYL
jgi:DNA-binding NtrC family response regulator